jgi:diacylglycerol kinase (ATP)
VDRILRACVNTWNGLRFATRSEAAFRQEIAAIVIAIPLAFVIAAEPWKRLLLILAVLFVMVVELLNTAIEKLADHVTAAHHPEIGRVKDMGSAAVGIALLIAGLAWLLSLAEWAGLL